MDFLEVMDDGQVLNVEHVGEAIVKTWHSMLYNVHLTVSKTRIVADGLDKAIVEARIRDYQGNLQLSPLSVFFVIDGQLLEPVQTVDGVAVIEITSAIVDEIEVSTANSGMGNERVIINAEGA